MLRVSPFLYYDVSSHLYRSFNLLNGFPGSHLCCPSSLHSDWAPLIHSKLVPSSLSLYPFKLFSGSPLFIGFSQNSDLVPKVDHNLVLTFPNFFHPFPRRNSQLHPILLNLLLAHKYLPWITICERFLPFVPETNRNGPSSFPSSANHPHFFMSSSHPLQKPTLWKPVLYLLHRVLWILPIANLLRAPLKEVVLGQMLFPPGPSVLCLKNREQCSKIAVY